MARMPKLITILGPTACGKSALGIELAQEFDGEIVSADSRQVYCGLDIGTGKVTLDEQTLVPHHLLDVAEPSNAFSVADYQQLAFSAIDSIISRGRLPFLVGGTALYIYAVIDNYQFDDVGPNLPRRRELEKKSVDELCLILQSLQHDGKIPYKGSLVSLCETRDNKKIIVASNGAKRSERPLIHGQKQKVPALPNPSDYQNPRRLIRAIEKLEAGGTLAPKKGLPRYDNLILGIDIARDELYTRIDRRVDERIKQGMIDEVVKLRQKSPPLRGGARGGVADDMKIDDWLLGLGLEYRFITEYLQGKWPSQEAMISRLKTAIHAFARRQLTWWRRDKRIQWIRNKKEAARFIKLRL